ncbi:hypothetical protein SAMN05216344_11225 [Polaromonas sp. OV174]|nr:hypothetical protein SAMN05216344_11225 [Polaromonas sp. OV174]
MKFMYEYCTNFFDTRHLVIAVNPNRIDMYESLLLFKRLTENSVENYDFANGAPAIGASLDLHVAPENLKAVYGKKASHKNLYLYFVRMKLLNILMPGRRYFTTNDPVMTPELLDYFFNQRTQIFQHLKKREKGLLHSIYNHPEYQQVLPPYISESDLPIRQRMHQRYSLKCPGSFAVMGTETMDVYELQVIELSDEGFLAHAKEPLPINVQGEAHVRLGSTERSITKATVIHGKRKDSHGIYGFKLIESDLSWRKLVGALQSGATHEDVDNVAQLLPVPVNIAPLQ